MRWYSMGLIASILVIAGCEGQQGRFEEPSAEGVPGAPPAAEAPGRAAPTAGAVPEPLEKAEETSEEVQEEIVKGDWDDATEKTQQLQVLSDSLKQIGAPANDVAMYDSAVTSLATGVQSRDQMAAALAANEVNRATLSMMESYSPRVPVAVGFMGVNARDALYHAQGGDWTKAEQAAKELSSNYSKVQPQVAQQDAEVDRKVQAGIEQLTAAIGQKNVAGVNTASSQILDQIDDIEDVYESSPRGMQQPPAPGTQQQAPQGTQQQSTQGTQR